MEIRFIDPKEFDLRVHREVLNIAVTNKHPTKTAKGVRLWLTEIDCLEWKAQKLVKPLELQKTIFPISLPQAGSVDNTQAHEIHPRPFEKTFDVFMARITMQGSNIGLAPLQPPDGNERLRERTRDFWSKINFDLNEKDFKRSDASEQVTARLKIGIQLTADGMATLSRSVTLEVPIVTFIDSDNGKLLLDDKRHPRWIV